MLCGSQVATIDKKYRLKSPASFRQELCKPEDAAHLFYVTSDDGEYAQIYPMVVWEQRRRKLNALPVMDPARLKYQRYTGYYGLMTQMDAQGRVLIPQTLRERAQLNGDVIVMGNDDHLEVWNKEKMRRSMEEDPLTNADRERLAGQGF